MRDIGRIDSFCGRLAAAWRKVPDFRFGQLICNIFGEMSEKRDPFFPEEDEMIEYIEKWVKEYVGE